MLRFVFCFLFFHSCLSSFADFDLQANPASVHQNGRFSQFISHKVGDRHVHLHYDVQHSDGVILLDHEPSVLIQCIGEHTLQISLNKKDSRFQVGSLLAGGRHHCGNKQVLLRRIIDLHHESDLKLIVKTEDAQYHHFFKDGFVKFSTNWFPEDHFSFEHTTDVDGNAAPMYQQLQSHSPQKRSLKTWLQSHWTALKNFGARIWANIKIFYKVGVSLLLSRINYAHAWNVNVFSVNYDPTTSSAAKTIYYDNGHIQCTNCFGTLDLSLAFQMNVSFSQLTHLSVDAFGNAVFNVEAEFNYNKRFSKSHSFIWARLKSQPIPFSIGGVPFVLQLEAPVESGYNLDVRTASRLKAHARATGSISYGLLYDPQQKKLIPQSSHSWTHSGHLGQLALQENGDVEVYLLPQVVVLVDKIGGPSFSLHAGIVGSADASSAQCSGVSGVEAHVNFHLLVGVGAMVDINLGSKSLIKKKWGPAAIYSLSKPVTSGCVVWTNPGFHLQPGNMIVGNSWTNAKPLSCSSFDKMTLALQLLDYDPKNNRTGGSATFGAVFNGHNSKTSSCTIQTTYTGFVGHRFATNQYVTLHRQSSSGLTYSQCSDDSTIRPPLSLTGYFGVNDTTIMLPSVMGCSKVTLSQ